MIAKPEMGEIEIIELSNSELIEESRRKLYAALETIRAAQEATDEAATSEIKFCRGGLDAP